MLRAERIVIGWQKSKLVDVHVNCPNNSLRAHRCRRFGDACAALERALTATVLLSVTLIEQALKHLALP